MKALTLIQPWATLVAIGAKRIETRSWGTSYRGPLAIHAAKGFPKWAQETCFEDIFWKALNGNRPKVLAYISKFPRGVILATCRLVDCFQTEVLTQARGGVLFLEHEPEISLSQQEEAFGDYSEGRYAWILDNVQSLPQPVPAKGSLGLWEWNPQPEGWR